MHLNSTHICVHTLDCLCVHLYALPSQSHGLIVIEDHRAGYVAILEMYSIPIPVNFHDPRCHGEKI